MIIETFIIENVGVYAGRQEANLTPLPGKPVILFGGLNGGGKTTILEGLQLCFYGPRTFQVARGGKEDVQFTKLFDRHARWNANPKPLQIRVGHLLLLGMMGNFRHRQRCL